MKFQKKILATAIAAAGLGGSMAANAIALSPSGKGEALLVPYYSAVAGNKTFLSITNTHDDAKAVKVRFREGVGSRDVFDFTLYLSAYDVWTAVIHADGTNVRVATQDASCTVPKVAGNPAAVFNDTRIPTEYTGNVLERLSEGHIEILEMAVLDKEEKEFPQDDDPIVFDPEDRALEVAVTHSNGVPADCDLVSSFTKEMAQEAFPDSIIVGPDWSLGDGWVELSDELAQRFAQPSGGLYAHAAVFNPTDGTYFTYAADALTGWAEGVMWFPQNSTGVKELSVYTTDQGLAWDQGEDDNGLVEYFDLPDLSTPALASGETGYIATNLMVVAEADSDNIFNGIGGAAPRAHLGAAIGIDGGDLDSPLMVTNPTASAGTCTNGGPPPAGACVTLAIGSQVAGAKRDMVTAALLHNALANDYITGGGYETEWLVAFPSRYLHVNAEGGLDANKDALPDWAAATAPFTKVENAKTGEACEEIVFEYWDREEGEVTDPGSIDFSPGGSTPDKFQLCYEVNVLAFNQDASANSAVLSSASVAKYVGLESGYDNGWGRLDFSEFKMNVIGQELGDVPPGFSEWHGLPATGFMAVADTSGQVARGATFRHHQDSRVGIAIIPIIALGLLE